MTKTMVSENTALVVLYYNKGRLTYPCVESILSAGYSPDRIFCFDNGSKPELFQQLSQDFPDCHHRRIDQNLGYAGGFNRSLQWVFESGFNSALFCTNDTRVETGAAEACTETAQKTGAGMVAPKITYISQPETIDSIGAFFDPTEGKLGHYHEPDLPTRMDPQKDYLPGTALWINRDTFEKLGGTEENFHMYWEDVDLCFRAHRENIPLARCYDAIIRHGGSQTVGKKPLYTTFYFQRNRIRFCKRHMQGPQLQQVMALIQQQLNSLENQWTKKNDQRRISYLKTLREELVS